LKTLAKEILLRHTLVVFLACVIAVLSVTAAGQTRRSSRRSTPAAKPAPVSAAQLQVGRDRVAAQIKTLTHFLYLFGGIARGIDSTQPVSGSQETTPAITEQNERSRAKIRDSVRSMREGLEKLETDLSANTAFKGYYKYIVGVGDIGVAAERQAAANRFDEAGRLLLKAADQLAEALAAIH